MTRPQTRKKNTGEPGNGGQYAARSRPDAEAVLDDGWVRETRDGHIVDTLLHQNGLLAEIKHYTGAGELERHDKFSDDPGDGRAALNASLCYYGGELHDAPDGAAAIRTWDNGKPQITVYMQNGKQQDPKPGQPAFTAHIKDGTAALLIHQQHGVVQDPSPGVPARIATLDGGRMKRSTFYTRGRPWKQVDEATVKLPEGKNVVITATRETSV